MVGNGTVIWLLRVRGKRSPFSVYILNLAIADFAFLLSLDAWVTSRIFLHYLRELIGFIISVCIMTNTAGLSLLMAISTERCLSVTFPIWYKCRRPAHLSTIVCTLIWGLSLCLGILWLLYDSHYSMYYIYDTLLWVDSVLSLLTLLVLCVSSLTLLIRVHCCSRRRQVTKLYRVILLTVLAYLVLGLPVSLHFLLYILSYWFVNFRYFFNASCLLAALNSAVNPVIYFFVGRQGQRSGRRTLRELLQSALTDNLS
ncbi:mas-related G-protein coupled receptor member X1-like [Saccopteryx bilineata]|uniref:mas-related G-protein coupled receptor member X1-like n=1 Tax=Saccopteryx bilineata TaxID=59482 RepID=UPI00338E75F8